jgi:hypothetical protein
MLIKRNYWTMDRRQKEKEGSVYLYSGTVKYCLEQSMKMMRSTELTKLNYLQNSEDMNTSLKQQLYVVRSSLGAVNNTLADAKYNESLVKEETNRVTKYMNTLKSENNEK